MRIRDLREDSDFTQAQIAKYLNIKQNTYTIYYNMEQKIFQQFFMNGSYLL